MDNSTDAGPDPEALTDKLEQTNFTCLALARLRLPGLPLTEQGWGKLVAREQWSFVETPAKGGKHGIKREYTPPAPLLALIHKHLQGNDISEEDIAIARARSNAATRPAPRVPLTSEEDLHAYNGTASSEQRMQMLHVLLKTMEAKLIDPLDTVVAQRLIEAVEAWTPFAQGHPSLLQRLRAVRTAAYVYLK